ncbi:uncharacterized protein LOC116255944 [Nymphaea colorata]|nr:uncharacterized protein LOC116255944 [Nymphaea colorata]
MFPFLVLALLLCSSVEGRSFGRKAYELARPATVPSKQPVLTIHSKDGDVIDCVDIYAQPAFDNPLLKDHKIQVRPSFVPEGLEQTNSSRTHRSLSNWRKSGSCPAGTVPILRSVPNLRPGHTLPHASLKITNDDPIDYAAEKIQENAWLRGVFPKGYGVFGASAELNVWNPHVASINETSLSAIVVNAGVKDTESLWAGWAVNPALFGDYQTRIFLQWHSSSTAPCYNLNCGGFVQTGEDITIGQTIATSRKGDKKHQYTLKFAIFKDMKTGNWILTVDDKQVGYWPGKLFSHLSSWANTTIYGGSVTDTFPRGLHTETQMGSGEPPSKKDDNYGTVSFAGDIRYMNGDGKFKRLPDHEALISNSNCYDLIYQTHMFKDHIYFGGQGHGPDCE